MSSTIGALIILIISVAFATGCGKVPNKFIGSYTGTWKMPAPAEIEGTWTGTVDKEGIIIMEIKQSDQPDDRIAMKGTVEKSGDVSASGDTKEVSLTLTGKIKDGKISGTIKAKDPNTEDTVSGTFEGKKK